MKDFFYLNRQKIFFWVKCAALILSCIAVFPVILISDIQWLWPYRITLFFCIVIGFTLVAVGFSVLIEYWHFKLNRAAVSIPAIRHFLASNSFQTSLRDERSRWKLTHELKTGTVENFPVLIQRDHEKWKTIKVDLLINQLYFSDDRFHQLKRKLKEHHATFQTGAIQMHICYNKPLELNEVTNKIQQLASMLTSEGFTGH